MGKYICKYHGKTGMAFVCSHINQNIDNRVRVQNAITATFTDEKHSINDIKIQFKLNYCSQCVDEYKFPSKNSEITGVEFDEMYEKDFETACIQCFEKFTLKS